MCTNQDISNTEYTIHYKGKYCSCPRTRDLILHAFFIFILYVVKNFLVSAIFHHIYLPRLLPKSYFKISTFQPNFLCSSYMYFKILTNQKTQSTQQTNEHTTEVTTYRYTGNVLMRQPHRMWVPSARRRVYSEISSDGRFRYAPKVQ